ncbi:SLC9A8 [Symbiodinium necroappetens]|uniref:Sodium/hydrogen exchanger 8 n=1 Tax=Symbiodinium necroappetens TaxID=1628268 RepID=A0A812SFL6_9DINO|nr:SLC9A8 [Symbiodinium necroappetens]
MIISNPKLTPGEAISTILVGIGLGAVAAAFPEVNRSTFQKLEDMSARQFMLVFIAPIIFAEGYGMKSQQFFDNITRILLHAFLGTLISALVVAVAIFYLVPLTGALKLELAECLAFGAMISSTDPVTTLAIFKEQSLAEKGRGHLYYSVLGESILNDAVAIALFGSFADLVRSGEVIDAAVSARIFLNFLKVFVASTLIGVAGGLATAFLLKSARLGAGSSEGEHFYFNIPEIGVALVLAYVPFLAAEACDLSGIVAIMFAGITMRHYAHFNLTQVTRQIFLPTVELIASLCETYVFILLGLGVFLLQGAFSASLVIWSALACLLGRLVHVYPLSFLANRISTGPKMSVKEMHMVWMAGLRGVIAFICALGFPNEDQEAAAGLQGARMRTENFQHGFNRCPESCVASFAVFVLSHSLRLMTQDAITEEQLNQFEESSGTLASPAEAAMGCMTSASGPLGPRFSAPGAAGVRDAGFDGRMGRLSAPSRLHGTGRPGNCEAVPAKALQSLCSFGELLTS